MTTASWRTDSTGRQAFPEGLGLGELRVAESGERKAEMAKGVAERKHHSTLGHVAYSEISHYGNDASVCADYLIRNGHGVTDKCIVKEMEFKNRRGGLTRWKQIEVGKKNYRAVSGQVYEI